MDLNSFASTIDYSKLTHINIAFENPVNADGELSFNNRNHALIAKARTNNVKILVSIGGGSASTDKTLHSRYASLLNETNRVEFALRLTKYLSNHGFDGLDVDIEGPAINKDYGAFIKELAKAMNSNGKLLTAALSQGYGGDNVPDSVFEQLDFVNIMAYDRAGPWNPNAPGQHSSFEFATNNVSYWLNRGLPRTKAVLGVPFYGYGFGEAFRKRDYGYAEIIRSNPGAEILDQIDKTIWYNGMSTIKAKSQFVVEQKLGGIMIWSLDYDVNDERSLLSVIHRTLTGYTNSTPERAGASRSSAPWLIPGLRRVRSRNQTRSLSVDETGVVLHVLQGFLENAAEHQFGAGRRPHGQLHASQLDGPAGLLREFRARVAQHGEQSQFIQDAGSQVARDALRLAGRVAEHQAEFDRLPLRGAAVRRELVRKNVPSHLLRKSVYGKQVQIIRAW